MTKPKVRLVLGSVFLMAAVTSGCGSYSSNNDSPGNTGAPGPAPAAPGGGYP